MFGETHWDLKHMEKDPKWLTGSNSNHYRHFFGVEFEDRTVLEIGYGLGVATAEIKMVATDLWVIDISGVALHKAGRVVGKRKALSTSEVDKLPKDYFDLVISYVVAQHLTDKRLMEQLIYSMEGLNDWGKMALQFLTVEGEEYKERGGGTARSPSYVENMVKGAGGKVVDEVAPLSNGAGDVWNGFIIRRDYDLPIS